MNADAKTVTNDVNTNPKSDNFLHLSSRNNIYKNKLADALNININDDMINKVVLTLSSSLIKFCNAHMLENCKIIKTNNDMTSLYREFFMFFHPTITCE